MLEVNIDHYLAGNLEQRARLEGLKDHFPIVAHGVGLSLGTDGPLNYAYIDDVIDALERIGATWYSEHLAWTGVPGCELATLLSLPRTQAVVEELAGKIQTLRSLLPVPFYLENIVDYLEFADSVIEPSEFFTMVCERGGAGILLDAENLYTNELNNQVAARDFVNQLAPGSVKAMHVAGGVWNKGLFVDDHGHAVPDAVLPIVKYICERQWPGVIILERDSRLDAEAEIAHDIHRIAALVEQINRQAEAQNSANAYAHAEPS
jgi:hypothetical protein